MYLSRIDIWTLSALKISIKQSQLDISDFIGVADAMNRAIITYKEFTGSLYTLEQAKLIEIEIPYIRLTPFVKSFFNDTSTTFPIELETKLSKQFIIKNTESTKRSIPFVSEKEFDHCVQQYLDRMMN